VKEKSDLDVLRKHIFATDGTNHVTSHDAQVIGLGLLVIADRLDQITKSLKILTKHGIRTWEGTGRVEGEDD